MNAEKRTRTVTIDPAAQARHKREHYRRRIAKGDRIVNVWMTPEITAQLEALRDGRTIEAVIADAIETLYGKS